MPELSPPEWVDLAELSDDEVLERYAAGAEHGDGSPWVRLNFVASLDGAITHDGRSGGLGDDADRRVFGLLRRLADVVLVGAGTVRAEGYGGMVLGAESAAWREEHALAPQPVFATVSRELALDPASPVFTDAPVRPIVFTCADAPDERAAALASVADVVIAGDGWLDPAIMLAGRGLTRVHCEGGPTLAGTLLAADAIDELCLTISPRLEGGLAGRLTGGVPAEARTMRLAHALCADSTLLLRYVR